MRLILWFSTRHYMFNIINNYIDLFQTLLPIVLTVDSIDNSDHCYCDTAPAYLFNKSAAPYVDVIVDKQTKTESWRYSTVGWSDGLRINCIKNKKFYEKKYINLSIFDKQIKINGIRVRDGLSHFLAC